MQVVARAGGGADPQQISAPLGRTNEQRFSTRAELINKHRLLHAPRCGRVVIALAAFRPWIADQPDAVVSPADRCACARFEPLVSTDGQHHPAQQSGGMSVASPPGPCI